MKTKKLTLIALLLLFGVTINAQTFITLQGRVFDSQTRKGIPYTAVAVQGTCVGTQANDQGEYKLKIEGDNNNIVFSAIGYKKQTVSAEQLQKNGNVRLEPHALELHEVQVTGYVTPQEIVAEAVRRIPQNYHIDTTVGTWFQRDYRMLNGELYLFDESVIDMLRYGYAHDTTKRYYHFSDRQREMDDNYKVVRKHRLLVYDSLSVRLAAGDMEKAMAPMDYSDNNVITDIVSTPQANWSTAARLIKKHKYDPIQEYTDADGVDYWLLRAYGRTNSKNSMAWYTLRIRKDNFAIIDAFGTSSYDEDFWEHYNTLPLDANVQAALDRFFASSPTTGDTTKNLISNAENKSDELDAMRIVKDTLTPTLPPLPRWQFYRYGGIGGNRLVGGGGSSANHPSSDTATHRCFSQQLALGARLNLGGRFSLSADLQYAWMTSPTDDHGRVSTHNLTLPLRLNFDLLKPSGEADMHIYLTVGGWGRFAFLGRLGDDWNVLGNSIDPWDYGFSIGIGMEFMRSFFLEWNSYRSLHNSILDNSAPALYRHNGAFTIGILF